MVEFGSVGEIGGGVGGVVVYEDYIYVAGGLEEGEQGVVLVGFAAVDEGEVFLPGDEGGVGVVVEGVRVDGELVHECKGVGFVDEGGEIGEDAGCVGGEGGAESVEDVAGGAEDEAEVVVVGFAVARGDWGAVGEDGAEIFGLGEGVDAGVEGAEFVGGEFVDYGVIGWEADAGGGLDVKSCDYGKGYAMACEV